MNFEEDMRACFSRIGEKKPLIHCINNFVTVYDVANAIRMSGALPAMAFERKDVAGMAGIASALVLNLGALTDETIDSMVIAGREANRRHIPVVVDAVAAGATPFRTETDRMILDSIRVDVLKGNAGEIATLAGGKAEVRGVEAMSVEGDLAYLMKDLSKMKKCVVVATGAVDHVVDGEKSFLVRNGVPLMGEVVGTGCMSTGLVASFCSVSEGYGLSSALAMAYFGIAGERAFEEAKLPGTFKVKLFDHLYEIAHSTHIGGINIEVR